MTKLSIYQADAFTDRLFGGNPAAVIPLVQWLPSETMQQIAMENNLSETAFFVPEGAGFRIRWFTPTTEVALCGHATLAAAFVIFEILNFDQDVIVFQSQSGPLNVFRKDDLIYLDFPAQKVESADLPSDLSVALNIQPSETWKASDDYLLIFDREDQILDLQPDFGMMRKVNARGIIVSAPGNAPGPDFVSRFFAPGSGIDEDPVTGSAHTKLVPFWSLRLGKERFHARQVSPRGGDLICENHRERVWMGGQARLFMEGSCYLEKI